MLNADPDPFFYTDSDLELFSPSEDLFCAHTGQSFNQIRLSRQLDMSAERAKQVCDAQTQLILAKLESCPEKAIDRQDRAQFMAFQLGVNEYTGIDHPTNPFAEPALCTAWDFGYTTAATQRKTQQHVKIERRLEEQGIDPENRNSQFELAAVALFNIGLRTDKPSKAERANRLAMEMCYYNDENPPTAKRQNEINRFMALQSERLLSSIEL